MKRNVEYTCLSCGCDFVSYATAPICPFCGKRTFIAKYKTTPTNHAIKKVIFNEPATIVLWEDGTKTIVKCQEGDVFDPEKGLAMAISKKYFGNKGNYCEVFKKWCPEEEEKEDDFKCLNTKAAIEEIRRMDESAMKGFRDGVEGIKRNCKTCKFESTQGYEHPCVDCYLTRPKKNWTPKEEV